MNKLILQFVNRPTNMLMYKFNLQIVNDFSDVLFIIKTFCPVQKGDIYAFKVAIMSNL